MTAHSPPQLLQQALALHGAGQLDKAEVIYRQILALHADHPAAWNLLGVIAHQKGHFDQALAHITRAIQLNGGVADFHANYGLALSSLQQDDRAADAFSKALALDSRCAAALSGLARLRRKQNRLDEAERLLRTLVSLRPSAAAWVSLGQLLALRRRLHESHDAYQTALRLEPANAIAHNSLGILLHMQHRYEDAIAAFRAAMLHDPQSPQAGLSIAGPLVAQGRVNEALDAAAALLARHPDDAAAASLQLLLAHYTPHDRGELFARHVAWAARYAASAGQSKADQAHDRDPDRRLRVGYVSPDFRQHSVAFFIEPLLIAHDRAAVEVFCYSDVAMPDDVTKRLERCVDHWRNVAGHSDEQFCLQVRDDRIDVLIELAGHTAGHRLTALAARPAPVQVTYLGYPDTTGLSAIDYRMTDSMADPDGDEFHSEKLIRLARCALCYRPPDPSPHPSALPARESGRITFGSFNTLAKLSNETLDLWSKLLTARPDSRLMLKSAALSEQPTRQRFVAAFEARGIASERLLLRGHDESVKHHLRTYHEIDVALDTYPYHGTTTTCDALWMGVPVVTLVGQSHVSRVGASLLRAVGLDHLATTTPQQFVDAAADLTADIARLGKMRSTLRGVMQKSALMDAPALAREIERAYRQMWKGFAEAETTPT